MIPCAITHRVMVQTTVWNRTDSAGRFSPPTMIRNTMLARPRGQNQARNSLVSNASPVPVSARITGSILMTVKLSSE